LISAASTKRENRHAGAYSQPRMNVRRSKSRILPQLPHRESKILIVFRRNGDGAGFAIKSGLSVDTPQPHHRVLRASSASHTRAERCRRRAIEGWPQSPRPVPVPARRWATVPPASISTSRRALMPKGTSPESPRLFPSRVSFSSCFAAARQL